MSNFVPFETTLLVRDTCLCLHTQRAARSLARRFDLALKPLGITNGQFSLMMSLNHPEPSRMSRVATSLGMDRTTLTAGLKVLERRGLVEIGRDPDDRRGRILKLTVEGSALLAAATPIWTREHAAIDTSLGENGAHRLRTDMILLAAL